MPILHAIILGIVQGVAEFIPISSSGHLALVPWLFGWDDLSPDLARTFDVALHVGTFIGAFTYFRTDVFALASAAATSVARRSIDTTMQRLAWLLVLATVPAGTIGIVLDTVFEGETWSEPWLIGVMLIVFGLVLLAADRVAGSRETEDFSVRSALLMGFAQALALQPGVSRSGATISMARWLRFDREAAVRLSFLMSLPVILGAGVYSAIEVVGEGGVPSDLVPAFLWGMAAAAVTGYVAVWATLRFVQTNTFLPFVVYRVVVGVAVIVLAAARS